MVSESFRVVGKVHFQTGPSALKSSQLLRVMVYLVTEFVLGEGTGFQCGANSLG